MVIVTIVVAPTIDFGTARCKVCVADPVLIEIMIYCDNLLQALRALWAKLKKHWTNLRD
jgi:hypothetical protein